MAQPARAARDAGRAGSVSREAEGLAEQLPLTRPPAGVQATERALHRYQVMAFVVGVGLATVVFIGIPLQLVHDHWPWTAVVQVVGTAHGIFYIVYLLTCLDLASRARFRLGQLLAMVASGFLPLLAFFMERKVTQRVSAQLAMGADRPPSTAAAVWSAVSRRGSD